MTERLRPDVLHGVWELTDWYRVEADGSRSHPFTEHAAGRLFYEPSGRVAVYLMHPDWPAGKAERGFHAYSGHFTVEGDEIHHHVDLGTPRELVGTTLVRPATLEAGVLRLAAPANDDPTARHVLEWQREP